MWRNDSQVCKSTVMKRIFEILSPRSAFNDFDGDLDCVCLCQAETRAEFAERSVAKLEKTIDDLEGRIAILEFGNPTRSAVSIHVPHVNFLGYCLRIVLYKYNSFHL